MKCPICGSTSLEHLLSLSGVPLFCNVLLKTREEALVVSRGDISLSVCHDCGHIFNQAFEPDLMTYTQAYENSLHFSEHFQEYARALARRLIEVYDLEGGAIAEIGCGNGDFLALLATMGAGRVFGFDPALSGTCQMEVIDSKMTLSATSIADSSPELEFDLVCCRHVIEHVADPGVLLREVASVAGTRDAILYLEVPNALFVVRDRSIWDIIYEHCHYFTASSFEMLLSLNGFEVLDLRESYHSQYLSLEARFDGRTPAPKRYPTSSLSKVEINFGDGFDLRFRQSEKNLQGKSDRRSVLWGAGSKGASLLNAIESSSTIDFVVDLNPRKQGMYIPGTGHLVVSPEDLKKIEPEIVWLTNPVYRNEISAILQQVGLEPRLGML